MPIEIIHSADGFEVSVSPPEDPEWKSTEPLSATDVLEQLSKLGCHSTAITDALDATGIPWRDEHDATVLRRRDR